MSSVYYNRSLKALAKLNKGFPSHSLGKHIATAMDGHCIENLSDKEFYEILNDYIVELESGVPYCEDLEQIIQEGLDLNHILDEEE
jgi:hypothetical protein